MATREWKWGGGNGGGGDPMWQPCGKETASSFMAAARGKVRPNRPTTD